LLWGAEDVARTAPGREWVKQNEELTRAYVRSMVEAIHFFKTNPPAVREILTREPAVNAQI
jgi:ABC-type nitrate/sulfonate/bicarbonate transport system substrate-binding protein